MSLYALLCSHLDNVILHFHDLVCRHGLPNAAATGFRKNSILGFQGIRVIVLKWRMELDMEQAARRKKQTIINKSVTPRIEILIDSRMASYSIYLDQASI
jgi:hypothetical protein